MAFIISTVILGMTMLPFTFILSMFLCGNRSQTSTAKPDIQAFQDRAFMNPSAITAKEEEVDDIYEETDFEMSHSTRKQEPRGTLPTLT